MLISVIIPSYKPKRYLWECLNSLIEQTFSKNDFEVILILNGCDDPYKAEIEEFISTKMLGMNVKFIHTLQGGVSNARNIGLDQACGEYITFIDDDDYVSSEYLSELYQHANSDVISLCYPLAFYDGQLEKFPYRITKQYNKYNRTSKLPFYKVRRYFDGPVYKLLHRSIISDRRFDINYKNGEDTLFMFLISDKIKYVNFTSRSAIYYRRVRLGSATSSITTKDNISNLLHLIYEYTNIFINGICRYNFYFYFTRILGAIRSILCK